MRQDLLHRAHSGSDDERRLAAWVDTLLIENTRLREAARWIPTAERLPETPSEDLELMVRGWRSSHGWVVDGHTPVSDGAVIAWRPLPTPPEVTL